MSRNQRLSFLGIAAVIAVVAVIVLTAGGGSGEAEQDSADTAATATATATAMPSAGDGTEESTPTPTPTPTATPKPQPPLLVAGKVTKLRFEEGETVRFRAESDTPDHIHVHGYDLMKDVEPGKTATMTFKADITGIFEIEFEDSAQEIAELRVDPK